MFLFSCIAGGPSQTAEMGRAPDVTKKKSTLKRKATADIEWQPTSNMNPPCSTRATAKVKGKTKTVTGIPRRLAASPEPMAKPRHSGKKVGEKGKAKTATKPNPSADAGKRSTRKRKIPTILSDYELLDATLASPTDTAGMLPSPALTSSPDTITLATVGTQPSAGLDSASVPLGTTRSTRATAKARGETVTGVPGTLAAPHTPTAIPGSKGKKVGKVGKNVTKGTPTAGKSTTAKRARIDTLDGQSACDNAGPPDTPFGEHANFDIPNMQDIDSEPLTRAERLILTLSQQFTGRMSALEHRIKQLESPHQLPYTMPPALSGDTDSDEGSCEDSEEESGSDEDEEHEDTMMAAATSAQDHILQGKKQPGPAFNLEINEDPSLSISAHIPLSLQVPLNIKQDIWSHKYIDFSLLLSKTDTHDNSNSIILDLDSANTNNPVTLAWRKKKPAPITTFAQWSQAFNTFLAIYTEVYPKKAPHLAKYMDLVRHLANCSGNWLQYDQEFRRLKERYKKLKWSRPQTELYTLALVKPPSESAKVGNYSASPKTAQVCWAWNKGRECKPGCTFAHRCQLCQNRHPKFKCFLKPNRFKNLSSQTATSSHPGFYTPTGYSQNTPTSYSPPYYPSNFPESQPSSTPFPTAPASYH